MHSTDTADTVGELALVALRPGAEIPVRVIVVLDCFGNPSFCVYLLIQIFFIFFLSFYHLLRPLFRSYFLLYSTAFKGFHHFHHFHALYQRLASSGVIVSSSLDILGLACLYIYIDRYVVQFISTSCLAYVLNRLCRPRAKLNIYQRSVVCLGLQF